MGLDLIALLTLVAVVAGFIDTIAGGGGLITLPALFLSGLNPVAALATNKLQASAGSFSATVAFFRRGLIEWKRGKWIALLSFSGGMIGALLATRLPAGVLQVAVPILLLGVALYFLFSPNLDGAERKAKMSELLFLFTIVPFIGFYDGIFGPGTGSFFMVAFVLLLGRTLVSAIANTKLANFSSNFGSLLIFIFSGETQILLGISMAIGAFIGAQLGAKFAVKYGAKVVRPLLIIMSTLMAIKLLLEPGNPLSSLIFGA